MFRSTMRKGFHMTFENGLTVSVQWGAGNYCDNYNSGDFTFSHDAKSTTAEVAVLYQGKFLDPQHFSRKRINGEGNVGVFLSPEEVAEIISNASQMEEDVFLPWVDEMEEEISFPWLD